MVLRRNMAIRPAIISLQRIPLKIWDVVEVNWDLGLSAFGGQPVHFKIVSYSLLPLVLEA
jgi:hypothetical protein